MGWIGDSVDSVKSIQIRRLLTWCVSIGMAVTCVLILWKALICFTGSESPMVVVISGSMEPSFKRGIEIPIVHRVIEVHERLDTGAVDVLTKGDNNNGDDSLLYAQGQQWLHRNHIIGRAVGFLPYVGWFAVIKTEHPIIHVCFNADYLFPYTVPSSLLLICPFILISEIIFFGIHCGGSSLVH